MQYYCDTSQFIAQGLHFNDILIVDLIIVCMFVFYEVYVHSG